jgi:hypothetical protein
MASDVNRRTWHGGSFFSFQGGTTGPAIDLFAIGYVEDAVGDGPGVKIHAAEESVLSCVEPHRGFPVQGVEAGTSSVPLEQRP